MTGSRTDWCNNVAQVPLLDLCAQVKMKALGLLALCELPQCLVIALGQLVLGKSCMGQGLDPPI